MFKAPLLIAGLTALATAALAQAPATPPAAPAAPATAAPAGPMPAESDWKPLDPANTLVIDSTKGRIIVEMHPELTPASVARIKALTRSGYYTGSLFYRVLAFAAQTGDKGAKTFRSPLPNLKSEATFTLTPTIPYASFAGSDGGDLGFVGTMPVVVQADPAPAPGQPVTSGHGYQLLCPGTAAFAHEADKINSANSQIFFMRTIGYKMEKDYTAWGRVVQGQDVVAALNNGEPPKVPDKMSRVRVMADMPAAERPTLQVLDTRSPAYIAMVRKTFATEGVNFNLCDTPVPTRGG